MQAFAGASSGGGPAPIAVAVLVIAVGIVQVIFCRQIARLSASYTGARDGGNALWPLAVVVGAAFIAFGLLMLRSSFTSVENPSSGGDTPPILWVFFALAVIVVASSFVRVYRARVGNAPTNEEGEPWDVNENWPSV